MSRKHTHKDKTQSEPGGVVAETTAQHGRRYFTNPSFFISVVALCISTWTAYTSTLSPPSIDVAISDPIFSPIETGMVSESVQMEREVGIIVTCSFTNKGASTGTVEDVLLRLERKNSSDKQLYLPAYQLDPSKLIVPKPSAVPSSLPENRQMGMAVGNAVEGNFHPVAVNGHQSIAVTFLFKLVRDVSQFSSKPLVAGDYQMAVNTRLAGSNSYAEGQVKTIKLLDKSIAIINSNSVLELQSVEEHDARAKLN